MFMIDRLLSRYPISTNSSINKMHFQIYMKIKNMKRNMQSNTIIEKELKVTIKFQKLLYRMSRLFVK